MRLMMHARQSWKRMNPLWACNSHVAHFHHEGWTSHRRGVCFVSTKMRERTWQKYNVGRMGWTVGMRLTFFFLPFLPFSTANFKFSSSSRMTVSTSLVRISSRTPGRSKSRTSSASYFWAKLAVCACGSALEVLGLH